MFGLNENKDNANQPVQPAQQPAAPPQVQPPTNAHTPSSQGFDAPGPVPMPPVPPVVSDIRTAFTEGVSDKHQKAPQDQPNDEDLLNLKQDALQKLTPLLNHLGQTPEEKFKTTMMLIQATDNPQLLGEAYDAANAIGDEKVRAQALLDVVNEINYFTNKNNDKTS